VSLRAGHGGKGSASFRREPFVPRGGPDGGDGGRGGSIVLRANPEMTDLSNYARRSRWSAPAGGDGAGGRKTGKRGADLTLDVPVGTLVLDDKGGLISDLDRPGATHVVASGGEGGRGNVHFKSSRNRAPRQYTEGEEGEQGHFLLELRTIADVGLVGYPNAGKSTLLRKISAARPKVAAYPFTTLHPIVGVIEFPGYRRGTVADIPGLIKGAHLGLGLGHEFLRHITRCHLLIFVVDIAGSEGRNPVEDLQNLRRELDLYDRTLSSRPWLVVANKMDLPGATENLDALKAKFPKVQILPTAAATGKGIGALKEALAEAMRNEIVCAAI